MQVSIDLFIIHALYVHFYYWLFLIPLNFYLKNYTCIYMYMYMYHKIQEAYILSITVHTERCTCISAFRQSNCRKLDWITWDSETFRSRRLMGPPLNGPTLPPAEGGPINRRLLYTVQWSLYLIPISLWRCTKIQFSALSSDAFSIYNEQ